MLDENQNFNSVWKKKTFTMKISSWRRSNVEANLLMYSCSNQDSPRCTSIYPYVLKENDYFKMYSYTRVLGGVQGQARWCVAPHTIPQHQISSWLQSVKVQQFQQTISRKSFSMHGQSIILILESNRPSVQISIFIDWWSVGNCVSNIKLSVGK